MCVLDQKTEKSNPAIDSEQDSTAVFLSQLFLITFLSML